MKATIIALSAAVLLAAAPAGFAQGEPGKTPGPQHKVAKKHHLGSSVPLYAARAKGPENSYPKAFRHGPGETVGLDREIDMSRQAGGGGGGM